MAMGGFVKSAFGQIGWYRRSLGFFLAVVVLVGGGWLLYSYSQPLHASSPLDDLSPGNTTETLDMTLSAQGGLYVGSAKVPVDITTTSTSYRYRYQVVNQPKEMIEQLVINLHLPQPGTEQTIGYLFVNNGGALTANANLADPQTIVYTADSISTQAQMSIEFEVPKSMIQQSMLLTLQEFLTNLPMAVWVGISIGLPALALLVLVLVALARNRKVTPYRGEVTDPPSRLSPAILGILLHGKITNRELAATLMDLSRRGHLVMRRMTDNDFRFRRRKCSDRLEDYEQVLLDQIFGPVSESANGEEISFFLAQELFSKKVSQAFILVYQKINQLGYFYANPLKLHRRYQIIGLLLFVFGLIGFAMNLLLITGVEYLLLFWAGMIGVSILITFFARGLPIRTVHGDRELAMWLAFRRYMLDGKPISFAAASQEKYLAYLPYAIIFGTESEWTKKFYELPFTQPLWYVSDGVATIDKFANQIFPFLGYLSQALALSSQPAAR